jgi:hypothetical protein
MVEATRPARTETITRVQEPGAIVKSPRTELLPGTVSIQVTIAMSITATSTSIVPACTGVITATGRIVCGASLAGVGLARLDVRHPLVVGVEAVGDGGELGEHAIKLRIQRASMATGSKGVPDMAVDAPGMASDTKLIRHR